MLIDFRACFDRLAAVGCRCSTMDSGSGSPCCWQSGSRLVFTQSGIEMSSMLALCDGLLTQPRVDLLASRLGLLFSWPEAGNNSSVVKVMVLPHC